MSIERRLLSIQHYCNCRPAKAFLMSLMSFLLMTATALAADVTLTWDANEEPVAGYRIYCSKQSGVYLYGTDSPNKLWEGVQTISTVTVTKCGRHYFVATAFDACDQESGPSNEVDVVIKPHNPKNLK